MLSDFHGFSCFTSLTHGSVFATNKAKYVGVLIRFDLLSPVLLIVVFLNQSLFMHLVVLFFEFHVFFCPELHSFILRHTDWHFLNTAFVFFYSLSRKRVAFLTPLSRHKPLFVTVLTFPAQSQAEICHFSLRCCSSHHLSDLIRIITLFSVSGRQGEAEDEDTVCAFVMLCTSPPIVVEVT